MNGLRIKHIKLQADEIQNAAQAIKDNDVYKMAQANRQSHFLYEISHIISDLKCVNEITKLRDDKARFFKMMDAIHKIAGAGEFEIKTGTDSADEKNKTARIRFNQIVTIIQNTIKMPGPA